MQLLLKNNEKKLFLCRRVHISETTSGFLSGEFDLEPGEGESREDGIRHAGIKTFLIKSVLKPVSVGFSFSSWPFTERT